MSVAATYRAVPLTSFPRSGQRFTGRAFSARPARTAKLQARAEEQGRQPTAAIEDAAQSAQPPAAPAPAPQTSSLAADSAGGSKGLLAGGAVGLGVAVFLAARLTVGGPSFAALEADAVPLDTALSNGRPTVLEFYAGICLRLVRYSRAWAG
jgi:hypothetical protein